MSLNYDTGHIASGQVIQLLSFKCGDGRPFRDTLPLYCLKRS
jgi:hypothetical protein